MTDRVRQLYDTAELRPLWTELWHRLSSGRPVARVRLPALTPAQRTALADLLGLDRLPPESPVIHLSTLDTLLLASVARTATQVTELIVGPLDNRANQRATAAAERDQLWTWLADHPVVRAEPALDTWVAAIRRAGLIDGSVARTREVLSTALAVLAALPADGRPLPAFAAEICGDPHALDDGTRLSTLVLRALAASHDEPFPPDAGSRRASWERAGIACDALSTTVLVAGLRPTGTDPLSTSLTQWADAGHACVITLAQLTAFGPLAVPAPVVWAVENPSVLAMAVTRFGAACPPLITTSGWPNSASTLLLRQLRAAGTRVRYHGDFDGEGLRIAAHLRARAGVDLWRMSTVDYLAAVHPGRPDPGRVTDTPWDPALADALRQHQSTVSEEHVADLLLADLAE